MRNYGLVVGKFCPLHLGHEYMINEANKRCNELLILSYSNPEFAKCPANMRRFWLNERFPGIRRIVLESTIAIAGDMMPLNTAPDHIQQEYLAKILMSYRYKVTTLYCSEPWGPACAAVLTRMLGHEVRCEIIDIDRKKFPVSGTAIRNLDPKMLRYLSPEVHRTFVRKIALYGGESTGKTTLAQALAKHYKTKFVSEYGRELYIERNGVLSSGDLAKIGVEQRNREIQLANDAGYHLFCDTSPLTTHGYHQWMFGWPHPALELMAREEYDGAILCAPDFPFVQDGTRIDDAFRMKQDKWYREQLSTWKAPVLEVSGSLDQRVDQVVQWLSEVTI